MLRLLFQLTVITIVGTTILVSFFSENQHVFNITFYLGVGLYIVQCTFYTVIQVKAYHTNIVKLEEFYDEDEHQRLKWARMSFYSAITLAFLASFVIINYHYYTFFMVLYTTFFVLFAIKFANFRIDAAYIVKALTISKDFTENITETNIPDQEAHINKEETVELSKLHKSLEKWIQEKKYKINDISIDEIVDELNTDRDTFRLYFRQKNNSDFRQWRTELRILEAQRIIKENPKISISEVSEDVGFNDKGNFHRLFKKFVGVTPSDFKDHCITDAILAKTKLSADVAQVIDSQGD